MADKRLPRLSPFRSYSRTEESGLAIFRHCTASTVYDTGMIEDNPGDAATCGLTPSRRPWTLDCGLTHRQDQSSLSE
ncbi:hypothetical protein CABS01_10228 [Colletotrichum abscissum]|uniref:uncharacterized protein n=1 Tax=Colletotrichum abscissum TaxID=1671311 RepID=UPI0027D6918C|nr:uncharacterized protein CABS01_10228 [Colletotrichum abscissum]KAK1499830.1 hypothetical protein CABS01_10228 [Colletotrichum abscissum]